MIRALTISIVCVVLSFYLVGCAASDKWGFGAYNNTPGALTDVTVTFEGKPLDIGIIGVPGGLKTCDLNGRMPKAATISWTLPDNSTHQQAVVIDPSKANQDDPIPEVYFSIRDDGTIKITYSRPDLH